MSKTASKAKSNKLMYCDYCGRSFGFKVSLIKHMRLHTAQQNLPRPDGLTCYICNIAFKNKGLLVCHNVKTHNPNSPVRRSTDRHICHACQLYFFQSKELRHHIREYHFNLLTNEPYCEFKKVNQVWFENVLNSKNIVEIKKVAENILLMRKLDDNTAMKVSEHYTETIDLRDMYPTLQKNAVQCSYCFKIYDKLYINKHITDVHLKHNKSKVIEELNR